MARFQTSLIAVLALVMSACGAGPLPDNVKSTTAPTPGTHTWFPITADPHAVQCNECHGTSDTFEKFDCITCHDEGKTTPKHSGVSDYEWTSQACYRCHPDGTSDGSNVDHDRYFPIGGGTAHETASCANCHVDDTDRTVVSCTGCHEHESATMTESHRSVGGFSQESRACMRCHADSQVDFVIDHSPFLVKARAKHFRSACVECHTSMRADKDWATDFTKRTCLGCHVKADMDPAHQGITDYRFADPSCLSCHPTGEAGATMDHARYFPIATGSKHARATCDDCHTNAANRQEITCTGCHEHAAALMTPEHTHVGGFSQASAQCLRCHAESQVNLVATHLPFKVTTGTGHYRTACLECHAASRADKAWAADFTKNGCISCHLKAETDPKHTGQTDYRWADDSCRSCHPDGSAASVDHEPIFPIGAGKKHANIECAKCHTNPTNRKVFTCTSTCHVTGTMTTKHSMIGGYTFADAKCAQCHADSQVNRMSAHLPFRTTSGSRHYRENCLRCHPATRTDKPFTAANWSKYACLTCHSGIHRNRYRDTDCLRCHADGRE